MVPPRYVYKSRGSSGSRRYPTSTAALTTPVALLAGERERITHPHAVVFTSHIKLATSNGAPRAGATFTLLIVIIPHSAISACVHRKSDPRSRHFTNSAESLLVK